MRIVSIALTVHPASSATSKGVGILSMLWGIMSIMYLFRKPEIKALQDLAGD